MLLAAANCEILEQTETRIRFRHGTYFTQTMSLVPKSGTFDLSEDNGNTVVRYAVEATRFIKVLLTVVGVAFVWLVYPPILVYMTLVVHPQRFVENLLSGV